MESDQVQRTCQFARYSLDKDIQPCTDEQFEVIMAAITETLKEGESLPPDLWVTVDWGRIITPYGSIMTQDLDQPEPPDPLDVQAEEIASTFNPIAESMFPTPMTQQQGGTIIDIPWGTVLVLAVALGLIIFAKSPKATRKVTTNVREFIRSCMKGKKTKKVSP